MKLKVRLHVDSIRNHQITNFIVYDTTTYFYLFIKNFKCLNLFIRWKKLLLEYIILTILLIFKFKWIVSFFKTVIEWFIFLYFTFLNILEVLEFAKCLQKVLKLPKEKYVLVEIGFSWFVIYEHDSYV